MTADGPYIETTFAMTVKARIRADVTMHLRVSAEEVAEWAEVDPSEVTDDLARDYVAEERDLDEEFDEVDVHDWEKVEASVRARHRVRITPPGWVPLFEDEHEHTDRGNRDMCQAGRCYLDTIVARSEPIPS